MSRRRGIVALIASSCLALGPVTGATVEPAVAASRGSTATAPNQLVNQYPLGPQRLCCNGQSGLSGTTGSSAPNRSAPFAPAITAPTRRANTGKPTGHNASGDLPAVLLITVGVLALVVIAGAIAVYRTRGRTAQLLGHVFPFRAPRSKFGAAEVSSGGADRRGDTDGASNLGALLESRGDLVGAEAAYRRADARGSAEGARNLAGLLLERGDVEGAVAAYQRADARGDAPAAATLGLMFSDRGDERAALDAYGRADKRGDAGATVNLGVLLERRGDVAGAEAAYRRADARGSADGAFNLGALLEGRGDPANAAAAYGRADERGDAGAAVNLGMLLERQHDYRGALAAFERAQRSDRPDITELARSRAQGLALGLSVAEEGRP
jgi:Flp pilus assembly protein TadD